jgi:hypothetical protein
MEITFPKCELIFLEFITLEALAYRFVMCIKKYEKYYVIRLL